jgi:hypothetical protein
MQTSQDVTGAFFAIYNKEINYKCGTSQKILLHMQKFHPHDLGIAQNNSSGDKLPLKQLTIHETTTTVRIAR